MKDRIRVDDSKKHPGLVFFQDRETRATVACERATGEIVGVWPSWLTLHTHAEVIKAAFAYTGERGSAR